MPTAPLRLAFALLSLMLLTEASLPHGAAIANESGSRLQSLLAESRYDEAAALARASIAAAPEEYGEDSLEEARLLDALTQALYRGGHSTDAEALESIDRAVAIKAAVVPNSREHATSLMQRGNVFIFRGDNEAALENYSTAVSMLEVLLESGETVVSRDLAVLLSNIGIVHKRRGDFAAALEIAYQALDLRERTLGSEHPDLATSYNNIANIYVSLGRYADAVAQNEKALRLRETTVGAEHELVAESLNNLATVLGYMGEYGRALEAQERALRIFRDSLGEEHERTWTARLNLAILESDMGDLDGAERDYEAVLSDMEDRFGPRSIELVEPLESMAVLWSERGAHERARDLYRRSLSIHHARYGEDTDTTDYTLQGLGQELIELGDYAAARTALDRALEIRESYGDPNSPELCEALNALGELALTEGRIAESRAFADRSRNIIATRLGARHPLMSEALSLLARVECADRRYRAGFQVALEAEAASRDHLRETIGVLGEGLALDYAGHRTTTLDLALSLLPELTKEVAGSAWDAVIRSRALVFDEMAGRQRAETRDGWAALDSLRSEARSVRAQLANLSLRGPGWEDPEVYRQLLDDARSRTESIDREMALALGESRKDPREVTAGFDAVRAALEPGEALVAFVRYGHLKAAHADWHRAEHLDARAEGAYLAFVVSGPEGTPSSVDLGDADSMDQLVSDWRESIVGSPTAQTRGFARVSRDPVANFQECTEMGRRLRRRIWDPVIAALEESPRTIFIVADGSLHLVNFGALVEDDGRFLEEHEARLWRLTAERSLCRRSLSVHAPTDLLVVGDPEYSSTQGTVEIKSRRMMDRPNCLDLAALRFAPLPGARREVAELTESWVRAGKTLDHAVVLTQAEARESALKHAIAESPNASRVVHLATHGFFLNGDCASATAREENPLVLSGLALAGADHWRSAPEGVDDGLLTAEEVAGLDLGGVRLAVLSACDTGLGAIRSRGEGVFGLQRAFQVAGARSVLMSLWSIGDESGREFMSTFYDLYFRNGRSLMEALRSASLSLLEGARRRGVPPHPRDWAAFVGVGDWN